jgi:hypothetical protein
MKKNETTNHTNNTNKEEKMNLSFGFLFVLFV